MRRAAGEQLAVSCGVLALGCFVLWQAGMQAGGPAHAMIGPRVFPALTGGGLVAVGLVLGIQALTGGWRDRSGALSEVEAGGALPALAWIAAGLALQILLLEQVGFIPASAAMFCCAARAFGSRVWWRDLLVGLALAALLHLGFTVGLGLDLPLGAVWGIR